MAEAVVEQGALASTETVVEQGALASTETVVEQGALAPDVETQILRSTAVTLPRIVAWVPSIGS